MEFLNIELEERGELFQEYNKSFYDDFRKEIEFLNSIKKEEKRSSNIIDAPKPTPSKLTQKIYRNLAKILHPDVSKVENAAAVFKKVSDYYEKDNLMGLRGSIESGLKIEVFNEKLNCDGCDECEKCDNDIIGIADMLKENNIETAYDFVDGLADQIEKKSGGIA